MLAKTMQNLLKKISYHNDIVANRMFKKEEIDEEIQNIEELKKLLREMEKILKELDNVNPVNAKLVIEHFIKIHVMLQNIIWHVDQLHDLTVEVIKKYDRFIEKNK